MKRVVVGHLEPCPRCFERSLVGGGASGGHAAAEELARRHYWIAEMTAKEGLPVDWRFVAVRMAQALAGLPEATLGEGDVLGCPPGWPDGGNQLGRAPKEDEP